MWLGRTARRLKVLAEGLEPHLPDDRDVQGPEGGEEFSLANESQSALALRHLRSADAARGGGLCESKLDLLAAAVQDLLID